MRPHFLILTLLLACTPAHKKVTVFYKEADKLMLNLKGENCRQSGVVLNEQTQVLREYFYNCEVTIERKLEEREIEQWEPSRLKKLK